MAKNKFSASESMQGYLFQCRHALLLLLRRNRVSPSVRMSVEKFDDVALESGGQPIELIQTKTAFAALVRRHGPMVWGVCRRVL